ncbi:MAG: hypothetical protein JOZ47_17675 [Kutzneria sp.]|nr:hypothetical protein [Kutzneria sp.]
MAATKYNFDAIDGCRATMSGQSGQFGGLGDGFTTGAGTSAGIFGDLDASAGLSGAVDTATKSAHDELHAAEELLRKVERALDAVQTSVRDAEQSNAKGLTAS